METSNTKEVDCIDFALPRDLILKIASSLQVKDLCLLACCSKFWKDLCGSEYLWELLAKERWPSSLGSINQIDRAFQGWRGFYANQHREMLEKSSNVIKFVDQCTYVDSIEANDYNKAIEHLSSMQFGFKDVEMFLFTPNLNLFVNLIGLHYCLRCLNIPDHVITDALQSHKISERKVKVQWWKLGIWLHGFRMRDESRTRCVSLSDFACGKEEELLAVLYRGSVHEVLRVQISIAKIKPTASMF